MRIRIAALCLVLALLLTGCGSLNFTEAAAPEIITGNGDVLRDSAPYCTANPDLAQELRDAILEQRDVTVTGWDTDIISACLDELLLDPALFWVTGYHMSASTGLRTTAQITYRWLYDDGPARYAAMCEKADEILAGAPIDDFDLALYLYDWLETNVTYAPAEGYDQAAYAAICEGSAVCGGIADAFAFLLQRGGIEACTVMGQVTQDGKTESHAWNYAVLDGAVYGFDLTWDNCDRYDTEGHEYLLHEWFAVTGAELESTHTPTKDTDRITATANADNYYIHEGYLLTDDSMDSVAAAWQPQAASGAKALTFRCADKTVYDAVCFRLFDLTEAIGVLRRSSIVGSDAVTINYTTQEELLTVTIYLDPADSEA